MISISYVKAFLKGLWWVIKAAIGVCLIVLSAYLLVVLGFDFIVSSLFFIVALGVFALTIEYLQRYVLA